MRVKNSLQMRAQLFHKMRPAIRPPTSEGDRVIREELRKSQLLFENARNTCAGSRRRPRHWRRTAQVAAENRLPTLRSYDDVVRSPLP